MERPKRTVKKTEAAENIAKLLSKGGGRKRSEAGEDKEAAAAAASGSEQSAKGKKQVSREDQGSDSHGLKNGTRIHTKVQFEKEICTNYFFLIFLL